MHGALFHATVHRDVVLGGVFMLLVGICASVRMMSIS